MANKVYVVILKTFDEVHQELNGRVVGIYKDVLDAKACGDRIVLATWGSMFVVEEMEVH